ncbi:DDE-type integrase/transposase/recombinase [Paenibacillus sp. LMG 31458]|uniref:DDE-type integrase/transposase/recombinase n=1 Tax=Paenibacillus phytorum TaxID=2654977 RepID=A0ABX1XX94_9BACL|nr:DDE-type integrase/transposase/recombinase [Paenibacillus phytorum]
MFCWNKNWIQSYESPWSLFEKFKYANEINSIELLQTLGTTQVKKIKTGLRGRRIRNLYTLEGFEEELLTSAFQSNIVETNKINLDKITSVLNAKDAHYRSHFNDHFVYCPMCLQEGYHSLFHQFKLIHECPFHHIKLENVCLNCHIIPRVITLDKNPAYPPAIQELINEKSLPKETLIRQTKYLNNIVEQDHRFIKKITKPMLGFKSFLTAYQTLKGIEALHMIRKGQADDNSTVLTAVEWLNKIFDLVA